MDQACDCWDLSTSRARALCWRRTPCAPGPHANWSCPAQHTGRCQQYVGWVLTARPKGSALLLTCTSARVMASLPQRPKSFIMQAPIDRAVACWVVLERGTCRQAGRIVSANRNILGSFGAEGLSHPRLGSSGGSRAGGTRACTAGAKKGACCNVTGRWGQQGETGQAQPPGHLAHALCCGQRAAPANVRDGHMARSLGLSVEDREGKLAGTDIKDRNTCVNRSVAVAGRPTLEVRCWGKRPQGGMHG